MNRRMRLYVILAVIVVCLVTLCLSTSTGQDRRAYETQMQVYGVSPGQSDAARAIDAYESLMQRYMDMTERNFGGLADSLDALARRLEAIDAKLASLDSRLARIEQHLGVKSATSACDPNGLLVPASGAAGASPAPAVVPRTP